MKKYSHYMVVEIEIYGVNGNCCANVLHVVSESSWVVTIVQSFQLSTQSLSAINQLNHMKIMR